MTNTVFYQILFEKETLYKVKADAVAQPVTLPAPVSQFVPLQNRILIVVNQKMTEKERLLLTNILKAVSHTPDQTDILEWDTLASRDARSVIAQKLTDYIILFGVQPAALQLEFRLSPYTPEQVATIWCLMADTLAAVDGDVNLKKSLWVGLQQLFLKV